MSTLPSNVEGKAMRDDTRYVTKPEVSLDGYDSLTIPVHRASTIRYPDAASFAACLPTNSASLSMISFTIASWGRSRLSTTTSAVA